MVRRTEIELPCDGMVWRNCPIPERCFAAESCPLIMAVVRRIRTHGYKPMGDMPCWFDGSCCSPISCYLHGCAKEIKRAALQ